MGRNIFKHLVDGATDHEFTSWVPDASEWLTLGTSPGWRVHRIAAGVRSKFWTENVSIRRELSRGDYDALFSLGDTSLPACPVPHLLLVQQAYLAYTGDSWGFEPSRAFRAKMRLMAAYFRAGMPTVSHFTVQTQSMKTRLCARWDIDDARVSVVPSAIQVEATTQWEPQDDDGQRPYMMYVASASPHKNFEIFAPMMKALPTEFSDVVCRLTVRPDEVPFLVERACQLGVLDRFEFLGRVDDVEALIAGARAFVMPSRLESFGLPYYEAMSVGCPLVVADRDFAREACGDAALYASPDSAAEFAQQVGTVLGSRELQKELSSFGRARFEASRISWPEVAAAYRKLLSNLLGT